MEQPPSLLHRLWELFASLLFPHQCVHCRRAGTPFCDDCIRAIERFPLPRCPRCDLPSPGAILCAACRSTQTSALDGLRVVGPYVAPLRDAVHALKYRNQSSLAAPLGAILTAHLEDGADLPLDGLIPVPLHPDREEERGYNQSHLIASAMTATGVPLRAGLLHRERSTPPQVGLSRDERLRNVSGAFRASPEVALGSWLLVDDVCTTGATLEACASALRTQGAAAVYAITLTRALHHTDDNT
jgi:ComF family protein